jgi:hypothetical protein
MYTVPTVTEEAAGNEAVTVTGGTKPLVEMTGPEKVVLAIFNPHMRVKTWVLLSACRQPGLSVIPGDPGLATVIYTN